MERRRRITNEKAWPEGVEKLNDHTARTRLPPLNALKAFEASARLGSLARAAEELNVTPGAVSQQVRQLEDLLGVALFRRHARGVELTDEAAAALPALSDAFERLRQAGEVLSGARHHNHVRLGAPPAFAMHWLTPRLAAFTKEHERFSVSVSTDVQPGDVERFKVDVDIRFGPGAGAGLETRRLLTETVSPAAAPDVIAAFGGPGGREAQARSVLAHAPLIHDVSADQDPVQPDWTQWLAQHGIERTDGARGDRHITPDLVVTAAAAGRGVALVRRILAHDAIQSGRLSPLLLGGIATLDWAYDLAWPRGRRLGAASRALIAYLEAEAAPFEYMGV